MKMKTSKVKAAKSGIRKTGPSGTFETVIGWIPSELPLNFAEGSEIIVTGKLRKRRDLITGEMGMNIDVTGLYVVSQDETGMKILEELGEEDLELIRESLCSSTQEGLDEEETDKIDWMRFNSGLRELAHRTGASEFDHVFLYKDFDYILKTRGHNIVLEDSILKDRVGYGEIISFRWTQPQNDEDYERRISNWTYTLKKILESRNDTYLAILNWVRRGLELFLKTEIRKVTIHDIKEVKSSCRNRMAISLEENIDEPKTTMLRLLFKSFFRKWIKDAKKHYPLNEEQVEKIKMLAEIMLKRKTLAWYRDLINLVTGLGEIIQNLWMFPFTKKFIKN